MKTSRRHLKTPETVITTVSSSRPYTPEQVQSQLKLKVNTFINFDAHSYLLSKRKGNKKKQQQQINGGNQDILKALLKFANDVKKKQKLFKSKREDQAQKSAGMMNNYRQRFKKISNPLQIIQFYIRHHKYQPKQHHQMLIDKLLQISAVIGAIENFNLDKVLQKVYILMNMIVDFNELRLFVVIIIMAADICMQSKQFKKATYFYNQARIASQCSGFDQIQIQSLIGLANIGSQLGIPSTSIIFLKKALAYAWKQGDESSQISIYDYLGRNYCLQARMDKAKYYHERFSNNQVEKSTSAVKKIYLDIIKEDVRNKKLQLYTQNVDSLLLQTLTLPIYNFKIYPTFRQKLQLNQLVDGQSPRMKISTNKFNDKCNEDAFVQIENILSLSQFQKQMPNPDIQANYTPLNRYGKHKREVQFSHTLQFHQIMGTKIPISDNKITKKHSLQKQIAIIMSQKQDPKWYEKMKYNVKQERILKLGTLREPIQKSHLKTYKRKRSLSNQSQNIRNSVNKAILSWIDPQQ